ncbi:response regulator [uncultured Vagococcus sp.]|uniref:response regulator n=1 Tax=uncultured Vagococcus sp. TaxID=189676 RepID=UPI0028D8EE9F|nr:response regulator [uncultured Vagococcus sp.]
MFNLLIVDDEDIIVEGLQLLIPWQELDVKIVATASSGEEALAIIEQQKIDILLTDISMDEISGLDLIQFLTTQQPSAKSVVLSGFNEFEYIKRGLQLGIENYLLKPVNKNELLQTIETITEKLRLSLEESTEKEVMKEHITKRIFFNQIEKNEFIERANLLKLELPSNQCRACILNWTDKTQIHQHHDVYQQISTLLAKGGIAYMTQLETNSFGFLIDDQPLEALKATLHQFEESMVSLTFVTTFSFYVGAEQSLFNQFHLSIESAETMQEYFSLRAANTSYFYDEFVDFKEDKHQHFEKELINKVDQAIDLRDQEALKKQIHALFQNVAEYNRSSTYIENLSYVLMLKLFQGFHKVYLDEFQQYASKLSQVNHLDDMSQLLLTAVDRVFSEAKITHYSELTRDLLAMVATSYQDSLSLKTSSKTLHVNTAYLGQLFQKELGVSFSEYLNNYRMQVAKQRLGQTSDSIESIALGVGFKDVSYFSRKFKQLFNQTPNDYRLTK